MPIAVIKCGGSILSELSEEFFTSIKQLTKLGYQCVIIHGGGPDINERLQTDNMSTEFYQGLRKTTKETFQIIEEVLAGRTNRNLVRKMEEHELMAIGINGSDVSCLRGQFIDQKKLGLVGEITQVNANFLKMLLNHGLIPVITPIAIGDTGIKLNINADFAAAAVANALDAERCIFITDVEGIQINGSVAPSITVEQLEKAITDGYIYGGMIPKVEAALSVVKNGLKSVFIGSGKKAFLKGEGWAGTEIARMEERMV